MTPRIKVKTTRHKGRGVFANCRIRKGEIIEVAPVIVLSRQEEMVLSKMRRIYNFCYNWGSNEKQTAFVMGCGSFYNHSYDPNITHYNLPKQKVVVFRALRDITKGEELTHNYNGSPDNQSPIRFTKNSWESI